MQYLRIGGRLVPEDAIYEYIDHHVRSVTRVKQLGYEGYDTERARLHNAIFNAAGFSDTRWGSARKTANWFSTMRGSSMVNDPDIGYDEELVMFSEKLEDVITRELKRAKER
jgi:hypothetical protein